MEARKAKSGSGVDALVDALVDAELCVEAGWERDPESAAVLVLAPTVMREEVVEVEAADVQDLASSAVGRAGVVDLELVREELETCRLPSAAPSGSDGEVGDCAMTRKGALGRKVGREMAGE